MSSTDFIEETFKVSSGVVALTCLKIMHEDFADDIRIVGNTAGITHNGEYYEPYGLSFPLPTEGTSNPTSTIIIEDITRVLASQFRPIKDNLTIEMFIISTLDLDYVELDLGTLDVTNVTLSGYNVTLTVARVSVLSNSLSSYTLDPDNFPGLFLV